MLAALQDLGGKLSEDIIMELPGKGFSLATQIHGLVAYKTYLVTRCVPVDAEIFDAIPPVRDEVIRVVGGGDSPWAMAMFKKTFSHRGTPSSMKYAYSLKYNDQGQICELVAFLDTLLLQNLMDGKGLMD
jgi:ketosteroid isomerase-like protein